MKNYLILFWLMIGIFGIQSCITVQVSPDANAKQKSYVSDDLYDTQVVLSSSKKKKQQSILIN